MKIDLKNIAGFSCNDETICVKGKSGKVLYYFSNPQRKQITFNLIAGKWYTENKLVKLNKPLKYICPELAPATIKREAKKFKFRVGNNPNKCTIDFSKKEFADVLIDEEINEKDIPLFCFVMFHENGHFFYGGTPDGEMYAKNEHYCDCYAAKHMLENGFNPSQCLFAVELCLSESDIARGRKGKLFNWLKRVKVK